MSSASLGIFKEQNSGERNEAQGQIIESLTANTKIKLLTNSELYGTNPKNAVCNFEENWPWISRIMNIRRV